MRRLYAVLVGLSVVALVLLIVGFVVFAEPRDRGEPFAGVVEEIRHLERSRTRAGVRHLAKVRLADGRRRWFSVPGYVARDLKVGMALERNLSGRLTILPRQTPKLTDATGPVE